MKMNNLGFFYNKGRCLFTLNVIFFYIKGKFFTLRVMKILKSTLSVNIFTLRIIFTLRVETVACCCSQDCKHGSKFTLIPATNTLVW